MANKTCIQDWSDPDKLGVTTHPTVENTKSYKYVKSYTHKGQEWFMLIDEVDNRFLHAPSDKFS